MLSQGKVVPITPLSRPGRSLCRVQRHLGNVDVDFSRDYDIFLISFALLLLLLPPSLKLGV